MRHRLATASALAIASAVGITIAALLLTADAEQPQGIRSTAAPAWGTDVRLVEELRIGALEDAEHYMFGRIAAVALGPDGSVYVADSQVPVIRMYDARGRFVRDIGREGEGPGEYRSIGGMRGLPDGRLALWDNRNGRITVIRPDGGHDATHPVASALFSADIFEVDRDGRFYVRTNIRRGQRDGRVESQGGWIRVAPDGAVLDTIPIPADPNEGQSFVLATSSGYDRPFTTQLVTRLSPLGYMITGRNDSYSFTLHRPGAPLVIERPYTPVPVTRPERAEWEAWAAMFSEAAANPPPSSPGVINPPPRRLTFDIPDVKPAYSYLRTDSQGRVWVRRYVAAQQRPGPEPEPGARQPRRVWREPPTWDVFQPDGTFLGTITMPWDSFLHDASDNTIWATVPGEFNESYLIRLQIVPSAR